MPGRGHIAGLHRSSMFSFLETSIIIHMMAVEVYTIKDPPFPHFCQYLFSFDFLRTAILIGVKWISK